MERHSVPNSNRASLRNSVAIDDPRSMAYVLYDQPPIAHRPVSSADAMVTTFLTPETDLDEPEHITRDDGMYMTVPCEDHEDDEVFVPPPEVGSASRMNVYQHHPDRDELMYGLIEDKLMQDEGTGAAPTRSGYRQMGIYGWRKKIIYLLLAVIVLLVGINAALTFWIVSYLGFSSVSDAVVNLI